ncbi:MAG: hypothetical protein ACYTGQ_15380 [Planctomycetota bacterium]|jgi:hypothetical protein
MPGRLKLPIEDAERGVFVRFVLGTALLMVFWAVWNDVHLMGVEPRHFTVYHDPLLPLENEVLFVSQYALLASTGPGMTMGLLGFAVCRCGGRRRLSYGWMAAGLLIGLSVLETVARRLGRASVRSFEEGRGLIYPEEWYVELSEGIVYTQSVNVTVYLGGVSMGALLLLGLWLIRVWR